MHKGFFTTFAAILAITVIGTTVGIFYVAPHLSPQPTPLSLPLTPGSPIAVSRDTAISPIPTPLSSPTPIPPPLPPQPPARFVPKITQQPPQDSSQLPTRETPPPTTASVPPIPPHIARLLPPTQKFQEKTPPPPETTLVKLPPPQTQEKVVEATREVDKTAPQLQKQAEVALASAEIPKPQNLLQKIKSISPSPDLVPETLDAFFKEFDFNNDNAISIDEAASFYYWVERNIKYRFDDEEVQGAPKGILVGDGRPGPDYRQSPTETVVERAGDCEDTSTLEAAFYEYWGIPAYIAAVNARDPKFVDHAITIVRINGNLNDFVNLLGKLMYWNFKQGQEIISWEGKSIPPGNYMLIDNAYSNNFGFLTAGVTPGAFTMQAVVPTDAPFGAGWDYFVDHINLAWTN